MEEKVRKYRFLRRVARVGLVLGVVFTGIILFVRSPWGQDLIVSKVVRSISEKTHTKVEIDRLFITFSGNILLEGLYLEDQRGDTLVYSRSVEANIPLYSAFFKNQVNIRSITWKGLRARISRKEDDKKYNFSFLTDALVPQDTASQGSQPLDISLGEITLEDFDIDYSDQYLGIWSKLDLGSLRIDTKEFNLPEMQFRIADFQLTDSEVDYRQTKPFAINEDTLPAVLPYVVLDNFRLHNVKASYNSEPDSLMATIKIGDLLLGLPKADLPENAIDISELSLENSEFYVQTGSINHATLDSTKTGKPISFTWPNYDVSLKNIDFKNNNFHYVSGNNPILKKGFNPNDIDIRDFALQVDVASYQPEMAEVQVTAMSFREHGGLQMEDLSFNLTMGSSKALVSDFEIKTKNSALNGMVDLNYPSVQELIDDPSSGNVELRIPDFDLDLRDLLYFEPQLADTDYMVKAMAKKFTGSMDARGTLARVELQKADIGWGTNTTLSAQGVVRNITRPDSLVFDLSSIHALSSRTDLLQFLPGDELGITVPATIRIDASVKGTPEVFTGEADIIIPEGWARIAAEYDGNKKTYSGKMSIDTLQLGTLLDNGQLGPLSATLEFSGGGNSLNDLDLQLKSTISKLVYREYPFTNLYTEADIHNGQGDILLKYKDANLDMDARASVQLDSVDSKIGLNLDLIGANLYALGITGEKIRTGFNLSADIHGKPDDFEAKAFLTEGVAVYDGNQYQLGSVDLIADIDVNHTDLGVKSDFLTATLKSNSSPEALNMALKEQFRNYFHKEVRQVSTADSVKLHMDAVLRPTVALTEVFFRDIQNLDSITIKGDYNEASGKIDMELHIPAANYAGISIDSLDLSINGTGDDLNFSAGLSNLVLDPIRIRKTTFKGTLKDKELRMDFAALNDGEALMHIAADMILNNDTISLHLDPKELIFNHRKWDVPEDNLLNIAENYLGFRDMILSRADQKLEVNNTVPGMKSTRIGIIFTDFRLQTFFSLLNPDESLADGKVNGEFMIENPYGATGLLADFTIDSLKVLQKPLGTLSLNATAKNIGVYDFNLALKDAGIDLDLTGDYAAAETGAALNLQLGINKLEMERVEAFTEGAIRDSKGIISGKVSVSGTTVEPQYKGKLEFDQVDFKVTTLNSRFRVTEEYLNIDTEGVYFDKFEIRDANGQSFRIDGSVETKELLNPTLDLNLVANEFQLLNSTEEDNELFYGIASIDINADVGGTLDAPDVEGTLKIRKVTDLTYIVPESMLEVQERDGVILFVNRKDPDDILTANQVEESPAMFRDTRIRATIEIADDSEFHIILDERSGDNLQISGNAELNLDVQPNNGVSLSGRYELNSGYYETSLYNLVKRRFEINPGSSITWRGDPTDARLDVTATYALETSVSPLMTTVTSGQDASITGKYRQVLPFMVYLNVDGELLKPELSFKLDMPEDVQGTFGGTVYSRVQQLNSQEAELNKQVFSLLALNRFFPDSGSDGSTGGTAALARDNVNKVLSGELNAFSDRIFGKTGFELDFDLNSFTDYQGDSPQDRTQLNINASKKLLDDRLIVTAGSAVDVEGSAQATQEPTPIIGNVSLEYLLTENGQYRLKGFRRNEFQNVIDGQLIVTGVALIFNREFNKLSELFSPLKEPDVSEKKAEKDIDESQDE